LRVPTLRPLAAPILLMLACLGLRAVMPALAARMGVPPSGSIATALGDLAAVGLWLALAWAGARLFDLLLLRAAAIAHRPVPYPRMLGDLVRAVLFVAAAIAILMQVFGQSAFGLVTTSSVAVAVVGFALRNIISDVFSGLVLGMDPPYRIGDWIETTDGCAGRVEEVSWRTTRLRTREGVAQVVPNGLVAARRLVAYGPSGTRYRVSLRVPLDAAIAPDRARRILLAGALDAGRDYPGLAPDVLLHEIADGAAIYLVRFHVPDYGREAACRDAVASAVLRALQHIGLEVARPAQSVVLERAHAPPPRPRRSALLRRIELFRGFTEAERGELEERMTERQFRRNATVVRQGEPGDSLFVLAEGALDVKVARGGPETVVDRMVPGDVFGEMSLLTGQPRSATVSAATDAVVFEIAREHLEPLLRRRPELGEALARVMAERQAHNAGQESGAGQPQAAGAPAAPEDLLARLRAFFKPL